MKRLSLILALLLCLAPCLLACQTKTDSSQTNAASQTTARSGPSPTPKVFTSGDYKYILLEDGTVMITECHSKASTLRIPKTIDGISVTHIGDDVFVCHDLTEIYIPDTITTIGDGAFSGCGSLTSITIPDSVISIGANPFDGCPKLTTIRVSKEHPALAVIEDVLFEKATKRLICYPRKKVGDSYAIPQGILEIGENAFLVRQLDQHHHPRHRHHHWQSGVFWL